jgi:dTDP-4-amino-4,6-dideoxygalactose transaminase
MDTRFPPQPRHPIVPLYPEIGLGEWGETLASSLALESEVLQTSIEQAIAHSLSVDAEVVKLMESGTQALYSCFRYLKLRTPGFNKVALPDFSCPQILDAIYAAGLKPILFDLTDDLDIGSETVANLISRGCSCVVWPALFGERQRSQEALQGFLDAGMNVILDEAQTFPLSSPPEPLHKRCHRIISFGRSKKLSCHGGGALVLRDVQEALDYDSEFRRYTVPSGMGVASSLKKELMLKAQNRLPRMIVDMMRDLNAFPKLEKDLGSLLDKRSFGTISSAQLDAFHWALVYQALKAHESRESLKGELFNWLRTAIQEALGEPATALLRTQQGVPPSCPLLCQPGTRYTMASALSKYGIQTTWYYLPLSQLKPRLDLECLDAPFSKSLSERILILPLNRRHSIRDIMKVAAAIRSVATNYPGLRYM